MPSLPTVGGDSGQWGTLLNAYLRAQHKVDGSHDEVTATSVTTSGPVTVGTFLSLGEPTVLTIASGIITVTRSFHRVDTEASAAADDLVTINGGVTGAILVIRAASGISRVVTVKDGSNLLLAGDCVLNSTHDSLTLLFDGTNWVELSRSNNEGVS